MAVFDRIRATTTSNGTPFVVSTTPPTGYLGFSKFANGATDIPVAIVHQTANEWQVCYCSWNSATNELTVTSVLLSTNADAAVTFSAGTKDVFVTASSRSVGHLREINTWTANNYFNGGNVSIGTVSPNAQFHILSPVLGGTAGNAQRYQRLNSLTSGGSPNALLLDFTARRHTTGTDWLGTNLRVQRTIDATASGFIDFGVDGVSSSNGLGFGIGTTTYMSMDNSGNVGIGTATPTTRFDVNRLGSAWSGAAAEAGTAAFFNPGGGAATSPNYVCIVGGNTALVGINFGDSDSSNTGRILYDNSDNSLRLFANSGERLRIDNVGNVGIGTTAPGKRLDVVGQLRASNTAASGYALFEYGSSATATNNWHVGSEGDGTFRWYNGTFGAGTELMRITSAGNVGIGTGNPSGYDAKLAVFNGNFALTTTTNRLYLYYASATNHAYLSAAAGGEILFANGTAAPVEKMRIDTNGNLGVGVTAPTFRFVAGNSSTDGGWIYSASDVSYLGLGGFSGAGDGAFSISYDRSNGNITLNGGVRDTPTPRIRIDNTGNVGINQTSPGARVHVTHPDGTNALLVAGTTKGFRVSHGSTASVIEGVDHTGVGSYQPLVVGGSDVRFTTSNNERMRIHASGAVSIGNTADPGAGITAVNATLKINRFNTTSEGGELQFCRASDDAVGWAIDLLGSGTGTDPTTMRWIDQRAATPASRLELNSRGVLNIVNDLGPASTDTLSVGFRGSPNNDQSANYTLALTDAGRTIRKTVLTAFTVTIPADATVDFPLGTCIMLCNVVNATSSSNTTQNLTIACAANGPALVWMNGGTKINRGSATNTFIRLGGSATLRKVAANLWAITGAGIA